MSDITIVLRAEFAERMQEVLKQLNEAGVGITNVNEDVGAVEGSVETVRVAMIQKMEFVDAVRTTFSYIADYPAGDPRDQDGPEVDEN